MLRTKPQALVGWESAMEAFDSGYLPHPGCKPEDPRADRSPGAGVRRLFQLSKVLNDQSAELEQKGDVVMASRTKSAAHVAYADALMYWAEMEKRSGMTDKANQLYQDAANAYANVRTVMPAVPQFGAGAGTTMSEGDRSFWGGTSTGGTGGSAGSSLSYAPYFYSSPFSSSIFGDSYIKVKHYPWWWPF